MKLFNTPTVTRILYFRFKDKQRSSSISVVNTIMDERKF